MLRNAVDDAERADAHSRLARARDLMLQALNLLDGTPVATDCDAHLDLAIHNLTEAIADVAAGTAIFLTKSMDCAPNTAETFGSRSQGGSESNPWQEG